MFDVVTIRLRQLVNGLNELVRKFVRRVIRKIFELVISDLELMLNFRDLTSSATFADEHFRDIPGFKTRGDLFAHALGNVRGDGGLFLEFGVYKGDSINRLAGLKPQVTFHGFDSFVGLPEGWTLGAKTGAFDLGGKLPPVRGNVQLIKGFFEDTLAGFLAARRGATISFMHIDCDLYSATRTILQQARGMLAPGSIIVFDEFINYPDWQKGEYKAFMEFVAEAKVTFEYLAYVRTGGQVTVRVLSCG
jgi:hypothetical protein